MFLVIAVVAPGAGRLADSYRRAWRVDGPPAVVGRQSGGLEAVGLDRWTAPSTRRRLCLTSWPSNLGSHGGEAARQHHITQSILGDVLLVETNRFGRDVEEPVPIS
jgi:hypothetical protein